MRNLPSVLTTESMGRGYLCMNGMRFLSMAWIVLGHTWQLLTYVLVSAKHQQMGKLEDAAPCVERRPHERIMLEK